MTDLYRRRNEPLEAMRMPVEPDLKAVEKIVEWLQPGLVALYDDSDPDRFDAAPADPVEEWTADYIDFMGRGEQPFTAKLGAWIVKDTIGAFIVLNPLFEEMFEQVA